ncbi:MAG: Beta-barrel assembly-enhancing protease [Chlamydiae bacterium]|nr:Beta-barrel assembly-enhancing protease [Chlamydiota bacterium]
MSQINWLEVLDWDEEHLDNFRSTAFLYIRQGKYDIAKDFFHTLVVLNPNNSFDLQTLGAIYLEENNPSLALSYLQKAKQINPSNNTITMNQIKAMLLLGYRNEAFELIENFTKTCTDQFMVSDAQALQMAYS